MSEITYVGNGHAQEQDEFKCSECEFKAFSESMLINHILVHHCKEKHNMPTNDNKTMAQSDTAPSFNHKNISTYVQNRIKIDQKWECSYCDVTCHTAQIYHCHLRVHRGENPYSCLVCEERFVEKGILKIHTKSVHNRELDFDIFSCYHCDYRCSKADRFTTHLLKHSNISDGKSSNFDCPKCFKSFRFKTFMKNHMRKVHCDKSKKKKILCPDCDYTTYRHENMKDHLHTHTGNKPTSCPFCEYRCITKSNLNVHMLIHTGEKKHLCNICGVKFAQKSTLETHMKIHSNERSYLCTECGYRSNTSGNLLAHMRKHTGEKKYACSICDSHFTQSQSLKTHISTIHSINECSICQNKFEEKNLLQAHMVNSHNYKPKLTKERHCKNEKRYKCGDCEKSFTQGHNLKLHKQKVHNVTNYK